MLRLTFTLAAALYAGFVIWGDPTAIQSEEVAGDAPVILAQAGDGADYDQPVILETNASSRTQVSRDKATLPDASLIAASTPATERPAEPRLIGAPTRISLIEPAAAAPAPATVDVATADPALDGLMKVTGSRVNLRAGPSTGNGVIDSLVRGTVVEQLGDPVNGWVELRDVATGVTGYMAARFLEPA